jgi:hypothetical protein
MSVFRAESIESKSDDPRWGRSKYKKYVVVRAENENKAMTLIEWDPELSGATEKPAIGGEIPTCPWSDRSLVSWTEIDDSEYPTEGEAEILDKG